MSTLTLSENIIRLRHEKSITQEQLAAYIGVTKASVSKWETKQSMPDILLLPQLAAFFDVTVDALLGYEPQLGREQIKAQYHRLATAFAEKPFEKVMAESRSLVKQYYSCYPFLLQMGILWLNHFMLAEKREIQLEILAEITGLCNHILENCKNISVCNNAVSVRAMADLQQGKPLDVIEALETQNDFKHFGQEDMLLIQAYQMLGQMEKADEITQIAVYQKLLELLSMGAMLLTLHEKDEEYRCIVIERLDALVSHFDIEHLHPNAAAVYHYQVALSLCVGEKLEKEKRAAIHMRLEKFVLLVKALLNDDIKLHADSFFPKVDEWLEELDLGTEGVRDRKLVIKSAVDALGSPVFGVLAEPAYIEKLQKQIAQWHTAGQSKEE